MLLDICTNRRYINFPRILQNLTSITQSSPPGQNGCRFADDKFRCIFVTEKFCISLKFVSKAQIDNESALVQVMAWCQTAPSHYLHQCWPSSPTHICSTWVWRVNDIFNSLINKLITKYLKQFLYFPRNWWNSSFLRAQILCYHSLVHYKRLQKQSHWGDFKYSWD